MFKQISISIICLTIIMSIGGAYATWSYAEQPPAEVSQGLGISISEFNYKAEEILPGGSSGPVEIGQDHFAIIRLIVDEAGKGYNLNSSGSIVHSLLSKYDTVHANQKVSGGNLKFILDVSNNTHNLYYCVEKKSDTLYYIYTYSVDALATVGGTDLELEVYRTTIVKDSKWTAQDSHLGTAKTVTLSSLGFSASSHSSNYTIDVTSWHLK